MGGSEKRKSPPSGPGGARLTTRGDEKAALSRRHLASCASRVRQSLILINVKTAGQSEYRRHYELISGGLFSRPCRAASRQRPLAMQEPAVKRALGPWSR